MVTFLDLDEDLAGLPAVVIVPIGLELTTSYGTGTALGPLALLEATGQVELFDRELDFEFTNEMGIRTLDLFRPSPNLAPDDAVQAVRELVRPWARKDVFLVGLGGEHTITVPIVAELSERYDRPLTVVQIDAHADLRDSYEGTPFSHACVARRLLDAGHSLVQIGVRAMSRPEWELINQNERVVSFLGSTLEQEPTAMGELLAHLERLAGPVYLTFDVDGLDPSLVPGTGTPVPGGLSYRQACEILRVLFTNCQVIGMDMVELAPIPGQKLSEYACASLLARALAHHLLGQDRARGDQGILGKPSV